MKSSTTHHHLNIFESMFKYLGEFGGIGFLNVSTLVIDVSWAVLINLYDVMRVLGVFYVGSSVLSRNKTF